MSYILLILALFLLTFCYLRSLYSCIIDYQVNNSARRKRRKGQTLIEWILYRRYRKEIPRILLITYFGCFIFHLIALALAILFWANHLEETAFHHFRLTVAVDYGLIFLLGIAFYGRRKNGQTYAKVERWIKKRKRQR